LSPENIRLFTNHASVPSISLYYCVCFTRL